MDLVITHLTDIHIEDEADLNVLADRTDSIVGAIAETIRNVKETVLLICVTGDVANSGKEEQYEIAELFFDDIYEKILARYNDLEVYFAFVPGNHDCDFDDSRNTVRATIIKSGAVNMNDATSMELCTSIQSNYFNFVEKYLRKNLAAPNRKNSIFTQNVLVSETLGDYRIKLHCFNTAWCSFKHETKEMLFGVPEDIDKKEDNDIVITLMHHASDWFNWDGSDSWEDYHKEFSDIILIGHDHYSKFVLEKNYDASTNYLIRGNQLYSKAHPDQSGFNIFKVNLEDNTEIFYTFAWNGKLYKRITDSKAQIFERNRFSKSRVSLDKELKEYLEDIEIDISCKYKSQLLLSNIYVFPALKGEKLENSNRVKTYREQENILDVIQEKKKILINGNKEYGKTALIKRLFMILYDRGYYPIFLDVADVKSANDDAINSLIRETYQKSYINLDIDEVMQLDDDKRVCFIDNFDDIALTDKSQKKFLEYINTQFGIVVLTANNKNSMVTTVKRLETNEYIDNTYFKLEIGKLRRYAKSRIVDKWLLLEDPDQDINSQEFDAKRRAKLTQMQSVLKTGYFNNTPLEFLLVLSYIDNFESMNADYSRYSYIYDCLIRNKINELCNSESKIALAYKTLLEILAYDLYEHNEEGLFDESYLLTAITNYKEEYPGLKETSVKIIERLTQHKILEERNGKYKFKHNYMYYYFVGSYIIEHLKPEEKEVKIVEILSDLSIQTNYSIALFIAYSLNTEFEVLPKIKSISDSLLKEFEAFQFEDQKQLLEKLNVDVLDKLNKLYEIPENSKIPELQKNREIEQDEYDDTREEMQLAKQEAKENEQLEETEENEQAEEEARREEELNAEMEAVFADFTKLLRTIEFQGDILKNYGTKIKNTPRTEIIELMGTSNLKLIGFMCNNLSSDIDRIIEIVEKRIKEDNTDMIPAKELLLDTIKAYVMVVWSEFVEINVDSLAYCLDCDLLEDDVIAYREKMQSEFMDMVSIEYMIRISDSKLPVADIQKAKSGKRKLSSFSMKILEHIVASFLSSYQYDSKDKESVCSILGFDYKKFFIEEKKAIALGLDE